MEISEIKKKLSSNTNWQKYSPLELVDMLESAMEEVELLEEQVRLLTKRTRIVFGGRKQARVRRYGERVTQAVKRRE